eukprot:scaffold2405_cov211-Pinguiococcus_pyrenoidosus.AAC.4
MQLTFSSLIAPKLPRPSDEGAGDAFAWQSREYLRKLLLGKAVNFTIEYTVEAIKRSFGSVVISDTGDHVQKLVAAEGWCRVKENSREGEMSPVHEELVMLSTAAQQDKRGVFQEPTPENGAFVAVDRQPDTKTVFEELKGKTTRALVDYVSGGASFRLILLEAGGENATSLPAVGFFLTGVACPRVNVRPAAAAPAAPAQAPGAKANGTSAAAAVMSNGGGVAQPEPYSREAKHFTEVRLLQRELDVVLEGLDRYGNLVGTMLHPKGNISVELLKNGFGRVADWSIGFTGTDAATAMRQAEATAKRQQLRIWRGWTPPTVTGKRRFDALVVEVQSGDTIFVCVPDGKGGEKEERVSLSSLRAPRLGNRRAGSPDEPWSVEAKEALRSRVIGRTVSVSIEYEREIKNAGTGDSQKRRFGTVLVGKGSRVKNVAAVLVSEGLAQVMRSGKENADERSAHFDSLVAAEESARQAKKGIHSGGLPSTAPIQDLTTDSRRAKGMEAELRRETRGFRARVEHVFNGGMFKIVIPREGLALMFRIGALRVPKPASAASSRAPEPLADEAKAYARKHLNQRDIEVVIAEMDRNGIAIGSLTVVGQGNAKSYAEGLLEEGLAKLDERYAEYNLTQAAVIPLRRAMESATEQKKGLHLLDAKAAEEEEKPPEAEEVTVGGTRALEIPSGTCLVRVADIADASKFSLHLDDRRGDLQEVNEMMEEFGTQQGLNPGPPMQVRRGQKCAALFDDGSGVQWYRAIVLAVIGGTDVRVHYVDYGNTDVIATNRLAPLELTYFAIPPCAVGARLALLRTPTLDNEFGSDAAYFLNEMVWNRVLECVFHTRTMGSEGVLEVSLSQPQPQEAGETKGKQEDEEDAAPKSVAEEMVKAGLATLTKSAESDSRNLLEAEGLYEKLREAQEAARRGRSGQWHLGDLPEDDD